MYRTVRQVAAPVGHATSTSDDNSMLGCICKVAVLGQSVMSAIALQCSCGQFAHRCSSKCCVLYDI